MYSFRTRCNETHKPSGKGLNACSSPNYIYQALESQRKAAHVVA